MRAPEHPTELRAGSWLGVLKRTVAEFRADDLTDIAAALTYYGVLSIFPALIALVSILGLIGHSATQPLMFLVWLWISNIAVLLGAELNSELERGRQIEAGHSPEREPFVKPRDTRKMSGRQARA